MKLELEFTTDKLHDGTHVIALMSDGALHSATAVARFAGGFVDGFVAHEGGEFNGSALLDSYSKGPVAWAKVKRQPLERHATKIKNKAT